MPVYAAVTRYGSHRPKHRRNIASRVPLIDPPPGSRCIPMRTVCYFVQRRRNSTHTHARRRAVRRARACTDAGAARAVRSRAAVGDEVVHVAGSTIVYWSSCGLSSPRGDEIEKLLRGRRVARPVPRPRALRSATLAVSLGRGTRRRRCVGPGPAGAACPTPAAAREPLAGGAGARGGAGGSAVRDSVRVGLELRTWDAGRAARRTARRRTEVGTSPATTGYRPVTGDSHRHIA